MNIGNMSQIIISAYRRVTSNQREKRVSKSELTIAVMMPLYFSPPRRTFVKFPRYLSLPVVEYLVQDS